MPLRSVSFKRVSFSYGDEPVLRNFSSYLRAGDITAVVGPSGAGKTTLADLIVGLYEPDDGLVLINEVPLSEIDLRAWRSNVGYVPQESVLFHDSVRRNVWMCAREVDDEAVERALRQAGAWEFVSALPSGTSTVVGERGSRLSGGQRQRLAIARALVHQPQLLILDEATTALDPQTEAEILSTIATLRGDVMILAISHQRSILGIADQVVRLEANGGIPTEAVDGDASLATRDGSLPKG